MAKRMLLASVLSALLSVGGTVAAQEWSYVNVGGEAVRVYRDNYGVPHIHAQTLRGLYYTMGYTVVQDRLTQLESNRRYGEGRLAEMYGAEGSGVNFLYTDYVLRRDYYTEAERQAMFDALPLEIRTAFQDYADGVNARIQEVLADPEHKMPKEIWDAGIALQPWTVLNSVAMCIVMARRFGERGGLELSNLTDLNAIGQEAFDLKYPINNPNCNTTILPGEDDNFPIKTRPEASPAPIPKAWAKIAPDFGNQAGQERDLLTHIATQLAFPQLGSYGLALAPWKNTTGRACFLGCPSMGIEMPPPPPQSSNEIDLHGPGFDASGANFAGVPCVFIGHNNRIAWTATCGKSDDIDTYIEQLNPADSTQYLYNGEWRTFESRAEVFQVKGQPAEEYTIYRSVHGPIFNFDYPNNLAFAFKRTFWGRELDLMEALFAINRAGTIQAWRTAMSRVPVSLNYLYADVDGNIGYILGGRYRVPAAGVDVRLPASGTGEQEWQRLLDFSEHPQSANPAKGYFFNHNGKPAAWWNNGDTGWFEDTSFPDPAFDYMRTVSTMTYEDLAGVPHRFYWHGTYEYVMEMTPPFTHAENIGPYGQSAFIDRYGTASPHSTDQQVLYANWQRKPYVYFYDSDQDGLFDQEEAFFGAQSDNPDSDGDGLKDGDEVRDLNLLTPGIQNPFDLLNPDVVGDYFSIGSDDVPDGQNDLDFDGVSNAAEFAAGTNPIIYDEGIGGFVFTQTPEGGWVEAGDPFTFSVGVANALGLVTYQWIKDGGPISGATRSAYEIASLTFEDSGWYVCQVTDERKAVYQTQPVLLAVFPADSVPLQGAASLGLCAAGLVFAGAMALKRRRANRL